MVNSGSALIWTSDAGGGRNFFNDQWLRFTGRSLAQDAGEGWRQAVHPDDVDFFVRQYGAAFAKRDHFETDYRLRRADGAYRWVHAEVSPRFDSHGDFLGYIGFCVDVTDKKAAADEGAEHLELRKSRADSGSDAGRRPTGCRRRLGLPGDSC